MSNYRIAAKVYDAIFGPINAGLRGAGLKLFPPRPGMTVLDIGCGTGLQLEHYQREGCRVCGVDVAEAMLEVARRRLGDAELHLGDAASPPLAGRTFDLVLASLFLHELGPKARGTVLEQARRLLGPDGRILVIDFHPGLPDLTLKAWVNRALILTGEILGGPRHFTHYLDFMARGGLPSLAADRRLEIEDQRVMAGGNMGVYLLRPAG